MLFKTDFEQLDKLAAQSILVPNWITTAFLSAFAGSLGLKPLSFLPTALPWKAAEWNTLYHLLVSRTTHFHPDCLTTVWHICNFADSLPENSFPYKRVLCSQGRETNSSGVVKKLRLKNARQEIKMLKTKNYALSLNICGLFHLPFSLGETGFPSSGLW